MQQEQEWSEIQTEKPEKEKIEFEVEKDEPKKEEVKQEVKTPEPEVKKEEPKELEGINAVVLNLFYWKNFLELKIYKCKETL